MEKKTREEYEKLQKVNVTYVQGFFFAKPSEKLVTEKKLVMVSTFRFSLCITNGSS